MSRTTPVPTSQRSTTDAPAQPQADPEASAAKTPPAEHHLGIGWQPYTYDVRCLPSPFYPADGGRPFFVRPHTSLWQPGQRQPESYQIGQETFDLDFKIGAYRTNSISGAQFFGGFGFLGILCAVAVPPLGGTLLVIGVIGGIVIGIRNILSPHTRHPLDPR